MMKILEAVINVTELTQNMCSMHLLTKALICNVYLPSK